MSNAPRCAVLILTRDEAVHLPRCLASVRGLAQEIFVVDSGSTDDTCAIAVRLGATVVTHDFVNQAAQLDWALDNLPITSDWVLRLDADEFLSPELRTEIVQALGRASPETTAFSIKRRVYFRGRWIRHGGYYPIWIVRLFRRGCARSNQRVMDEKVVISHGNVRRLRHDLIEMNCGDLRSFTLKHEAYAQREAEATIFATRRNGRAAPANPPATGQRHLQSLYDRCPLFWRSIAYFLYRYVIRLGFLDRTEGLVFHILQGFWYRFYVDAKVWELKSSPTNSEPTFDSDRELNAHPRS